MEPFHVSFSGLYNFPLFQVVNLPPCLPQECGRHFPRASPLAFPPLNLDIFFFFFKPIVVRKLQEFELPYVSVTSLRSQEYKIVLRKRSGVGWEEGESAGLDYGAMY